MIDFACKKFSLEEIIKCSLGLTKSDYLVLKFFIDKNDFHSSKDVSNKLRLDLSTVQRSVKKLYFLSVIERSQKNLKNGYIFLYKIKPKREIRNIILNIVKNWTVRVEKELEKW